VVYCFRHDLSLAATASGLSGKELEEVLWGRVLQSLPREIKGAIEEGMLRQESTLELLRLKAAKVAL